MGGFVKKIEITVILDNAEFIKSKGYTFKPLFMVIREFSALTAGKTEARAYVEVSGKATAGKFGESRSAKYRLYGEMAPTDPMPKWLQPIVADALFHTESAIDSMEAIVNQLRTT